MPEDFIQQLADDITRSKSPDDYHRGLRRALDSVDALQSGVVSDSGVKLACRTGCSATLGRGAQRSCELGAMAEWREGIPACVCDAVSVIRRPLVSKAGSREKVSEQNAAIIFSRNPIRLRTVVYRFRCKGSAASK